FRPFTQGEGSTTRKFGGTGLGLAICKRILDRMGGTVTVRSQPDEGTTFHVRLPLDVLPPEDGPAPRLSGVVCLLCESATRERDTLRRYLESDGATVLSPEDAEGTAPDVVILGAEDRLPQGLPPGLPGVLIGRDGVRGGPVRTRDGVFLDSRAMPRDALIRAVALALGQEAPPDDTPGTRGARYDAPLFTSPDDPPLILVAEDDHLNQSVILRQLEILGLRAEIAVNGLEALEKWRRGQYALLLSDLHMPEIDGYGLTAAIRADEAQAGGASRLPILALTADAVVGEVSRARRVGMDDYLTKPLSLARLGDALRRWLPVQEVTGAVGAGAGKVIERSDQSALLGDDPATVHAFLTAYATQSRDLVAQFAEAVETPREAAMILHRLKSSSRWVGARGFGDLCEALEQAAKAGDTDQLAARRAEFASLHVRVLDEIAKIRHELAAPP
ncbi:MAG TPA: response regulator, partial [Paracoccus sp.]|nr:response regulator [Paracoccus sp. (in: a-proteobacteria)]